MATYQKILKSQPEHPIALNNVASLLGAKDPKLGIPYAEKAYAQFPSDPSVSDNLGWLAYKSGDKKRGLELIKKALNAAPATLEFQFHHAYALADSGDKLQAKRELENMLKNQKNFPSRAEAQALLATL